MLYYRAMNQYLEVEFSVNTSHVVPFLTTITLYHVVEAFWHFASEEHAFVSVEKESAFA